MSETIIGPDNAGENNEKLNLCKILKGHEGETFIAFHTIEQAEEFLNKPENFQLLKDYFMV